MTGDPTWPAAPCGCHQGPWWGITQPSFDWFGLPTVTITATSSAVPGQAWECPRCHVINAPAAMTCHGKECQP